jgi:hypothetical protein
MRSFVDVYDQALKGVNVQKNVPLFQAMLQANYQLLEAWLALLSKQEEDLLYFVPDFSQRVRLDSNKHEERNNTKQAYLEMMKYLINKDFTENDFLPTVGVDLAIFAMGAGHDFKGDSDSNQQPCTGADAFTIMHQSLLNYCGVLASADADKLKRPGLLQSAEEVFKSYGAKLVGFEMHGSDLVLYYNKILGSHSCQIKLNYERKTKAINIALHFCGGMENEKHRWGDGAALALFFNESAVKPTDLNLSLKKLSNHELVIELNFKREETIKLVGKFFKTLNDIANNEELEDVYSQVFSTLPNKAESRQRTIKTLRRTGVLGCETALNLIVKNLLRLEDLGDYREVIALASDCMKSENDSFQFHALGLFQVAVENGQGFEAAIAAANKGLNSGERDHVRPVLALFKALFEKKQGFKAAIVAASSGLKNHNPYVFKTAEGLFELLFEEGQGFDEARTIIPKLKSFSVESDFEWKLKAAEKKHNAKLSFITRLFKKLNLWFIKNKV